MAKLDQHLRRELLRRMAEVKEDHRDPATGVLDTRAWATDALEEWRQDDPDGHAEFATEAQVYTAIVEYEKDAQGRRSRASKQLDAAATLLKEGDFEEDFDAGAVDSWNLPSPGELDLEYHVPVGGGAMLPERLGDMTVPQVFALADYHEKREVSARKWKNYFRRVGYLALFWKKRKALGDEATLWEIFGVTPGDGA